jgi:hypothetical protein
MPRDAQRTSTHGSGNAKIAYVGRFVAISAGSENH